MVISVFAFVVPENANVTIDNANTTSPTITASQDGSYTIKATVTDKAGNISEETFTYVRDTDSVSPATLTGTPANPSNDATLNVTVGGSNVAAYKYALTTDADCLGVTYDDNAGLWYAAGVDTITDAINADTTNLLCVIGRSASLVEQETVSQYGWLSDTTPPTLSMNAVADVVIANQTSITVAGGCDENGATVTITGANSISDTATCDGANWSVDMNLSAIDEGNSTLYADMSDAAGNPAPQASRAPRDGEVKAAAAAFFVPPNTNS